MEKALRAKNVDQIIENHLKSKVMYTEFPTAEYGQAFEKIEKSILSCDKLNQIEIVNRLVNAFEKDCGLPIHIDYLNNLIKNQVDYMISLAKSKKNEQVKS